MNRNFSQPTIITRIKCQYHVTRKDKVRNSVEILYLKDIRIKM